MKRLAHVALIVACLSACSEDSVGPRLRPAPIVLSGRILQSGTNAPIDHALVVVMLDERPVARSSTTGDGVFRVPDLPPGNYRVLVRRLGYRPMTVALTLPSHAGPVVLEMTQQGCVLEGIVVHTR